MVKYLILLLLFTTASANEDKTLGMSKDNPTASCHEIYQRNPTSRGSVGQYWIKVIYTSTYTFTFKRAGVY